MVKKQFIQDPNYLPDKVGTWHVDSISVIGSGKNYSTTNVEIVGKNLSPEQKTAMKKLAFVLFDELKKEIGSNQ